MANSGRVTSGNMPRLLQLGVDSILTHLKTTYQGPGSQIFKEVKTEKAFFEATQLAGVGMASEKGQGEAISTDSVDQNWVYRWPVVCYEKSLRVTFEAMADNLYEDLLPMFAREQAKALAHAKDYLMAAILNNAFATTGPDGKVLCASDHPIQAGGTCDNTVTLDLSEDAIEQMVIKVDGFTNPDGLLSDYSTANLIIPKELRFEADRILKSQYRQGTPDNDINALNQQGCINKIITWKRLSDTDAFFITTDAERGFTIANRQGVVTESFKEPTTKDVIVSAYERYVPFYQDFRCVIGSPGA